MEKREVAEPPETAPGGEGPRATATSATPHGHNSGNGWLSKIFSQVPSSSSSKHHHRLDHLPPQIPSRIHPQGMELEKYDSVSSRQSVEKERHTFPETGVQEGSLEIKERVGDQQDTNNEQGVLAEIVERMKQRMFTRDEANRLIELLRSRTTEPPNFDGYASKFVSGAAENPWPRKDAGISRKDSNMFQTDQRMTKSNFNTLNTDAHNEVGSSPVEIAKAYMQGLTSTPAHENQSRKPNIDSRQCFNDDSVSNLSLSSAVKAPICWPGAVVQKDSVCFTPQKSVMLRNVPRTPHSTVFSKTISKTQVGVESPKLSSTLWKQSYTPVFGSKMTMKRRNSVLGDDLASFDSLRRVRQKNVTMTSSKRDWLSDLETASTNLSDSSNVLYGPTFQKNVEHGLLRSNSFKSQSTSGDEKTPRFMGGPSTVHPQSSEIARKILEQLDRTVPSPKDKARELNAAITRTKVSSENAILMMDSKDMRSVVTALDNQQAGCSSVKDVVNQESMGTQKVIGLSSSRYSANGQLSDITRKTVSEAFPMQNSLPQSSGSVPELKFAASNQLGVEQKASENTSKPVEDAGFGFTFPVQMDSGTSSEPPTPTLVSSLAAGTRATPEETIPPFTFGSSSASCGPLFVFDAVPNPNVDNADTAMPKFNFGSDEKRLSFRSVDKDAMWCR